MPLALSDTAAMLRCEPVVAEVSQNQAPQSQPKRRYQKRKF